MDEGIHEGVLWWFGHAEKVENDRIAKRGYVGGCGCSHSVGRPRKKWTVTVKDYLRTRSLDVRQARRIVHDRIELRICEGK